MGTNCDLDPKKVSKFQWCLSYASCDEMIEKGLCNVGLMKFLYLLHIIPLLGIIEDGVLPESNSASTCIGASEVGLIALVGD